MAALKTQLLLPHQARPLADILLKFISTNKAGPHGTSVLPVTLLAVIEQVKMSPRVMGKTFCLSFLSFFILIFFRWWADFVAAGTVGCPRCSCRG
jgi:hypothetical protein